MYIIRPLRLTQSESVWRVSTSILRPSERFVAGSFPATLVPLADKLRSDSLSVSGRHWDYIPTYVVISRKSPVRPM